MVAGQVVREVHLAPSTQKGRSMTIKTTDVPTVLGGKNTGTKNETWQFAVVGTDDKGPRYLGFTNTYEEAVKLQGNATTLGWQRVAVFDATLTEVKEKPKQ